MHYVGNHSHGSFILVILVAVLCASASLAGQESVPDNMGGGLRQLIESQHNPQVAPSSAFSAAALLEGRLLRDTQSRVLVNVWLDGTRPVADVHEALAGMGANVAAELATYRKGVI